MAQDDHPSLPATAEPAAAPAAARGRRHWLVLFRLAAAGEAAAPVDALGRALRRLEMAVQGGFGVELQRETAGLAASFASARGALMAIGDARQRLHRLPPQGGRALILKVAVMWSEEAGGARLAEDLAAAAALLALLPREGVASTRAASALLEGVVPADVTLLGEVRTDGLILQAVRFEPHDPQAGAAAAGAERPRRLMLSLQGKRWYVEAGRAPLRIGRATDNDLVIEERHVSRRHARIVCDGERFVLTDTSANGSCVFSEDGSVQVVRGSGIVLPAVGWIGCGRHLGPEDENAVRFSDDSAAGVLARVRDRSDS
ncbi:MAG: FHA domain-containing protein [Pseudomonadota bacterium]